MSDAPLQHSNNEETTVQLPAPINAPSVAFSEMDIKNLIDDNTIQSDSKLLQLIRNEEVVVLPIGMIEQLLQKTNDFGQLLSMFNNVNSVFSDLVESNPQAIVNASNFQREVMAVAKSLNFNDFEDGNFFENMTKMGSIIGALKKVVKSFKANNIAESFKEIKDGIDFTRLESFDKELFVKLAEHYNLDTSLIQYFMTFVKPEQFEINDKS